jgi:hypothetical protein
MAILFPVRISPAFNQPGQSAQRYGGLMFNDASGIPELAGLLPLNIGATTLNTSVFNVAGFNTFMVALDVTVANITMKYNLIDPRDQATIVATRSLGVGAAGGGYQLFGFGFGNIAGSGGTDVFYFISLAFTGAGAGATINQFPGLWGSVR